AVVAADQDLANALRLIRIERAEASDDLNAWLARSDGWATVLAKAERRSLYNPARLARLPAARPVTRTRHAPN
ncbi:MAG TPA: hypothetical protein VFE03_03275, partial [Caulobacteraceae bacterium]|nr:hypothetical protein [Caulobacteraceae bacterium]